MIRTEAAVVRPSLANSGSARKTPHVPISVAPSTGFTCRVAQCRHDPNPRGWRRYLYGTRGATKHPHCVGMAAAAGARHPSGGETRRHAHPFGLYQRGPWDLRDEIPWEKRGEQHRPVCLRQPEIPCDDRHPRREAVPGHQRNRHFSHTSARAGFGWSELVYRIAQCGKPWRQTSAYVSVRPGRVGTISSSAAAMGAILNSERNSDPATCQ